MQDIPKCFCDFLHLFRLFHVGSLILLKSIAWMIFGGVSCFGTLRRFSFLSEKKFGMDVGMVLDELLAWWVWCPPCLLTCTAVPPNHASGSTD